MTVYAFERNNLDDLEGTLDNFLRNINEDKIFSIQYSAVTDSTMLIPRYYSALVILKEN